MHRSLRGWWGLVFGVGVVAAGCSDGGPTSTCVGAAPALDDCVHGAFYADCGGTGEPVFGCNNTSCLWFTHSCVAEGFTQADCTAENLCCEAVNGGTWPFRSWQPPGGYAAGVVEDVAAIGRRPFTAAAPGTIVRIDSSLEVPGYGIACEGDSQPRICNPRILEPELGRLGDALFMRVVNQAEAAEALLIEFVPQPSGEIHARAVLQYEPDIGNLDGAICEDARSPQVDLVIEDAVFDRAELSPAREIRGRLWILAGDTRMELAW